MYYLRRGPRFSQSRSNLHTLGLQSRPCVYTWSFREMVQGTHAPTVPLLRALWSLLEGTWGLLKGSWGLNSAYEPNISRSP